MVAASPLSPVRECMRRHLGCCCSVLAAFSAVTHCTSVSTMRQHQRDPRSSECLQQAGNRLWTFAWSEAFLKQQDFTLGPLLSQARIRLV